MQNRKAFVPKLSANTFWRSFRGFTVRMVVEPSVCCFARGFDYSPFNTHRLSADSNLLERIPHPFGWDGYFCTAPSTSLLRAPVSPGDTAARAGKPTVTGEGGTGEQTALPRTLTKRRGWLEYCWQSLHWTRLTFTRPTLPSPAAVGIDVYEGNGRERAVKALEDNSYPGKPSSCVRRRSMPSGRRDSSAL